MKNLALSLALSCALLGAGELSKPDKNLIEIYQNSGFITQKFSPNSKIFSVEIPAQIDINSLEILSEYELENLEDSGIYELKSVDRKEIEKEISKITSQKKALEAKIKFSQNLTNSSDATKFYEDVLADFERIEELQMRENELGELLARTPNIQMRHATLSFADTPKSVSLRYQTFLNEGASAKFSADTKAGTLEITQSIRIKNPLNSEISKADIAIYPYPYSARLAPNPFFPSYIGETVVYESNDAMYAPKAMMAAPKSVSNRAAQAQNVGLTLSSSYQIENINFKANESAQIEFDKQNLPAKFSIFIDAYGSNNAFLQAKTKAAKVINAALTTIEIDGVSMGKEWRDEIAPNSDTTVFLGQNRLIKVSKKIDEKNSKENFFGTKKTTISSWNYEIQNASERAWDVEFVSKMPLSADEKVKITDKSTTKAQTIDDEGKATWNFNLKNGEKRVINFGYEIEDSRK